MKIAFLFFYFCDVYAIIDVETTGFGSTGNKITDIAIFIHDGEKVVKEFESLVNPECQISYKITQLTGITNDMVKNAPKFYEIAKEVHLLTEGCVFVAHNVNFDYGVIRSEYRSLGGDYQRKKLCTVRLGRKLIPGHKSYSLGKLCHDLGITISGRHRAYGDAEATVKLFEMMLDADDGTVFETSLNRKSNKATLPPLLPREVYDNLPTESGVYYFRNQEDHIIYVGKAKNIKQRVLSHFHDKAKKEVIMCQRTANITYQLTGNELVALLFESAEIKRIYPVYNRSQKRTAETHGIFWYEDRAGVLRLGTNYLKLIPKPIATFYNTHEARNFLEKLAEEYELCPKFCNLHSNVGSCFHYQIKKCKGVCCGKEDQEVYNARVKEAIASISRVQKDFVIMEEGRKKDEKAVILIEGGVYKGFGYMKVNKQPESFDEYQQFIEPQRDNRDIQRILRQYLKKNDDDKIIYRGE
jgi:DNA polymerase-3 subunit epsilon